MLPSERFPDVAVEFYCVLRLWMRARTIFYHMIGLAKSKWPHLDAGT
jgi:hypothetical protein